MNRVYIPRPLRRLVLNRARECCEYCLIHQADLPEALQLDHLIAVKHRGRTTANNLACSCAECNRYKGTDLTSIDPVTGGIVPLFNPRKQKWSEHFKLVGVRIEGRTATGRATVELLQLNSDQRLLERTILQEDGRYPPAWFQQESV
jgi:hypothetical protein